MLRAPSLPSPQSRAPRPNPNLRPRGVAEKATPASRTRAHGRERGNVHPDSNQEAAQALSALVNILAPLVAAKLAPSREPEIYSSEGPLPHRYSRRRFLERVRDLPAAQRIGGKRGRGVRWSITRAAWEASFATHAEAPRVAPVVSLETIIAKAGYRATRTG